MSKIKKALTTLFTFVLLISSFSYVYGENEYQLADASSGSIKVIEEFDDSKKAINAYNEKIDEFNNLVLIKKDKIIKMEYGIVKFNNSSCSLDEKYNSLAYGEAYINSCYASDGAYLYTSDNEKEVAFKLAGDIGTIDIDKVTLVPYEMIDVRLSKYSITNNKLHHDIKTSLNNDYYAYSVYLDNKVDYLNEGQSYYSYDGHFFYDDFKTMIDDYRNENYDNSINHDYPYYNYYEFLPHRSYTNYNLNEIEDYFTNELCFDGKIQRYDDLNLDNANDDVNLSQFYDELDSFFGYEKLYGANAMMMLSLATHESAYGKSYSAFVKNNLFNHAAFDTESERNASRYINIDASIYSHAKYYVSRSYAGIHSSNYYGSFFGNKLSGMNVRYSSDPYWGEKVAANYYRYDEALGFKDKNSYALGIINSDKIKVYDDESLSSLNFELNNIDTYSVIILEEIQDAYKIQIDASYNSNYLYNPQISVGYIDKDLVSFVINEDKIQEKEYRNVSFDLSGGEIIGENNINILVLKDNEPAISEPIKNGYEFIGFDHNFSKDVDSYKAMYKKIDKIEIHNNFNNAIEYNYIYDLKGGKLKVYYEDGTTKIVDINTNMIESYEDNIEGESLLTINYCGIKIYYPVTFSKQINEYRDNIAKYISSNIESYKKDGTYNIEELTYIKDNLSKVDYLTSFEDIRYIDKMLLESSRDEVNYHFKDSKYDVSISGLALSLKEPEKSTVFKPFKDTYYVEVGNVSSLAKNRLSSVAKAYGFDVEDSLKVSVEYNLSKANFDNPIIIQVKLQDKKKDRIYSVYHLDEDGNVKKCMTTQTANYVSFMTRSEGDFMILSMDSVNTYDIEDRYENMSIHNADPDNHLLFIEGGILTVFTLLGFIMIIIHNISDKKKEKIWNDYRKLLQEVALHQEEKPKN